MRDDARPPSTLLAISYQLLAKDRTFLKAGQRKKLITACNHPSHTHPIDGQLCLSITMRNDSKGNSAASSLHYALWRVIESLRSFMTLHKTPFHSLAACCFGHRQVIEAVWLSCYATASQQSHSIFTASLTMRNVVAMRSARLLLSSLMPALNPAWAKSLQRKRCRHIAQSPTHDPTRQPSVVFVLHHPDTSPCGV